MSTPQNVESLPLKDEGEFSTTLSEKEARKVTFGALIGTALEWYDFFLFNTAAALVFNVQFFTNDDPVAATLSSFATLAVGFLARPLGGMIFGSLGDKVGRRTVMLITVTGIGIATAIIGLLPTYMTIGVFAPVLLVVLRFLQGIFVGGEWSGAMTIAIENAPPESKAKLSAIPQIGSPIGTILASGGFFLVSTFLSQDNFDSFGWRIPFLVAIPLLLLAVVMRRRLDESPAFREIKDSGRAENAPLRTVWKNSWLQIFVGAGAAFLGVGGFYLITTFVVSYGKQQLGLSPSLLLFGSIFAAAVEIVVLITGGNLGSRFGASKVIIWGGVASILLAFPTFLLVQTRQPILVVLGMTLGVAALSYPYATSGAVLSALFPLTTRLSGMAMAQNLSGVASGFVPLIATAVVAMAGNAWWPAAVLLIVISAISAVCGAWAPRLSQKITGYLH
ncbi:MULTISPECIES: MFS transporter [Micrococcaceae]|uniref:MFS transporter n=1 Tax=unclassified Kocuria TaxID=2649579 RepID=UPI001013B2DC|nr:MULTISPECIES: MFS transporter [unclassified Kocuria]